MVQSNEWIRRVPHSGRLQTFDSEWLVLSSNLDQVRGLTRIDLSQTEHLSIDAFDLLKVIGKGSFGKVRFLSTSINDT